MEKNSLKKSVKIKVDNYEKLKKIINIPSFNEKEALYMSDEETAELNSKLVRNNVKVYRLEEENSLENVLLNMMDGDKND